MVWVAHCDGTAGSRVKNELIGSESVARQLESDDSPTVWIREISATPLSVGRNVRIV